ncbi:MAG: hypothetical protein WD770_01220 [Actinomycetota bacterium]
MRRSGTMLRTAILGVAAVLLVALGLPAHAAPKKSSVSISKVTVARTVAVSGKLTKGADGAGAIQVAADEAGDDTDLVIPNGLDITTATIRADLAPKMLTFHVDLADAMPELTMQPGFVLNWQLTVDGNDTGTFIHAGQGGVNPPTPGPYFYLCRIDAEEFFCEDELDGEFLEDGATVEVPFGLLGARPGSRIGTSAALDGAESISTTVGVAGGAFLTSVGGDEAAAKDYTIPGGVSLGIARAGTALSKVVYSVDARVKGASFSGSVPKPRKAGTYIVVARTCYGAGVCRYASKTIRI